MTIEKKFDIPFIAALALREKQIQQSYRPIIAVHKWFARRPGTLFRGLMLAEYASGPLDQTFYRDNQFPDIHIADPFMGGGTPLIEANRLGCDVTGYDINPMAWWVVSRELEHLDLKKYARDAEGITAFLQENIGELYRTTCIECGNHEATAKYFIWVKTIDCRGCGRNLDLFPGYLLARDQRHPRNVFICHNCGELAETEDRDNPGPCNACGETLAVNGPAKRSRCQCHHCGLVNTYPDAASGPPKHRMVALEYFCHSCKTGHRGRFFKKPAAEDLANYQKAEKLLAATTLHQVPEDEIPPGDESNRLHRWGYRRYRELFNSRQLLGLELLAGKIAGSSDRRIHDALATNLSDLLRYQNLLCRYDTMALKSLDIFSVHGFPVGLMPCESNLIGMVNDKGINVGSGGWLNIVEKFRKAKEFCDHPFEIRHQGTKKTRIPLPGEWIGDTRRGDRQRTINLVCGSATTADLEPGSLDGVFTDPPYLGNVQYAELMDFCYVWLQKLSRSPSFREASTRSADELTANQSMGRDLTHFTAGLAQVFGNMAAALKPGRPFVFTYHHNDLKAYYPLAVALLDAGLVCSATLPCPAEMGASIHINGTGSSVVDTVFVCRATGVVARSALAADTEDFARLLLSDSENLRDGGRKPTKGDIRCLICGHLTRMTIWSLRHGWDPDLNTGRKLTLVAQHLASLPQPAAIEAAMSPAVDAFRLATGETSAAYETAEIAF